MADLTARFLADFSEFATAVDQAETRLADFRTGAKDVETALARVATSFSGKDILQQATLAAKAIEDIGGVTKLTASEQARLNATMTEAIAKAQALGQSAPQSWRALADATQNAGKETAGFSGVLSGAIGRIGEWAAGFLTAQAVMGIFRADIRNIKAELIDMVMGGSQIADVTGNFEHLTEQAGRLGSTMIGSLRQGTHSTISDFELMQTVNRDLAAGMNLTDAQFHTLAQGAFALAQATGTDVKSAFETMNQAMLTGRTRTLAMMGVKVDLTAAEEKFATQLGTSAKNLNDVGKLEAARIGILDAVAQHIARLGDQTDGLDEIVQQVETSWTNFHNELKRTVATSPVLLEGFAAFRDALLAAFGPSQQDVIDAVAKVIDDVAIVLVQTARVGVEAAGQIAHAWVGLRGIFYEVAQGLDIVRATFTAMAGAGKILASDSLAEANHQFAEMVTNLTHIGVGMAERAQDTENLDAKHREITETTQAYVGVLDKTIAAMKNARDAHRQTVGAVGDLESGMHAASSAITDLEGAQEGVIRSSGAAAGAQKALGEAAGGTSRFLKTETEDTKALKTAHEQLFGLDLIKKADILVTALGDLSHVSQLSAEQQQGLHKAIVAAIETYARLGKDAPQVMRDIAAATEVTTISTQKLRETIDSLLGRESIARANELVVALASIGGGPGSESILRMAGALQTQQAAAQGAATAQTDLVESLQQTGVAATEMAAIAELNAQAWTLSAREQASAITGVSSLTIDQQKKLNTAMNEVIATLAAMGITAAPVYQRIADATQVAIDAQEDLKRSVGESVAGIAARLDEYGERQKAVAREVSNVQIAEVARAHAAVVADASFQLEHDKLIGASRKQLAADVERLEYEKFLAAKESAEARFRAEHEFDDQTTDLYRQQERAFQTSIDQMTQDYEAGARLRIEIEQRTAPTIMNGIRDAFQELPSIMQRAFEGGGGALGAAKSFGLSIGEAIASAIGDKIKTALSSGIGGSVQGAVSGVESSILGEVGKKGGGLLGGLFGGAGGLGGMLGGVVSGLASAGIGTAISVGISALSKIGKPSAEELAGREGVASFASSLYGALDAAKKLEVQQLVATGSAKDWAQSVVGLRESYMKTGISGEEAFAKAGDAWNRLWAAEKQGPEAVSLVIAQIQAELEQMGAVGLASASQIAEAMKSFSGEDLFAQADAAVEAVNRLGGVSTLTAEETARLRDLVQAAIEKYHALGKDAPKALQDILDATGGVNDEVADFIDQWDLTGETIMHQAAVAVQAVDRIGGITKLTADQQKRLNDLLQNALEAYNVLGLDAPPELKKVADALASIVSQTDKATEAAARYRSELEKAAHRANMNFEGLGTGEIADLLEGSVRDQWGNVVSKQAIEDWLNANPGDWGRINQAFGNVTGFQMGTGGRFLDFGTGRSVMLHGRERVMTEAEGRADQAGWSVLADRLTSIETLLRDQPRAFRDLALQAW